MARPKALPHSQEAEHAVLGALLLQPSCIAAIPHPSEAWQTRTRRIPGPGRRRPFGGTACQAGGERPLAAL